LTIGAKRIRKVVPSDTSQRIARGQCTRRESANFLHVAEQAAMTFFS
jgi:hypothetical protein